uniref:Uncharacterized protein n=1 Tax=Caenorhabditis japonica TaxID=281687 RepID=A0A8R1HUF9_CAEJA
NVQKVQHSLSEVFQIIGIFWSRIAGKKTSAARSGLYIQNSGFKRNTNPGRVTKLPQTF